MENFNVYINAEDSPGVISAKLWLRGGSRADPLSQKGAHQLLSSLLSRGCGPYSYERIGDLIEGCGACLNCETYEDGNLISLKCIENDVYDLLPILGWMVKDPHFKSKQIELEKELTIQSLIRQKENPFYLAFDGWRKTVYGEGPYGHDPLGSIEDLKNIDKNQLHLLSQTLNSREKIMVITGSIPEKLPEILSKLDPFNIELNNQNVIEPVEMKRDSFNKEYRPEIRISLHPVDISQVVLMLGQPTIAESHKDALSLHLLSTHLGCGMSSKLFLELREKHGVAYDVGVHHPVREGKSPFLLHASTSKEKSLHTLKLLRENWLKVLNNPITEDELSLAKAKYRSQLAHGTQTVSQKAERKAHLLGIQLSSQHDKLNLEKVKDITPKDIHTTANKYLNSPILSLCGHIKYLEKLSKEWQIRSIY
tara:strand:- start:21789 stop:23057 length:1269 start_codon:yes stop_codon:yes gene_type:complete